jgi:hypothetical protein
MKNKENFRVGSDIPQVHQRIKLICRRCQTKQVQDVGTIFVTESQDPDAVVQFSKYFRCQHCDGPGPFEVVDRLKILDEALASKVRRTPKVYMGRVQLFDGTACQTAAMLEAHLEGLIAKDPENAFLHVRLGNLMRASGCGVRAIESYERALRLDPYELEALSSVRELALDCKNFRAVLTHSKAILDAIGMGRRASNADLTRGILCSMLEAVEIRSEVLDGVWAEFPQEFRESVSGRVLREFMDRFDSYEDPIKGFADFVLRGGQILKWLEGGSGGDMELASDLGVSYAPPLDQLLRLGEPDEGNDGELGLGMEHIPELIRMATDESLSNADPESDAVWASVHAWRWLGRLRAEEAVVPLLGLLWRVDEEHDDWLGDELPEVLAEIGPVSMPPVAAYLADSSHGEWARETAVRALSALVEQYPELRNECVRILARQLEHFDDQSDILNAALIDLLLQLKAVETAPLMEKAFAAGLVDETRNGDWEDVQIKLGLRKERETERKPNKLTELTDMMRERLGWGAHEATPFFLGFPVIWKGRLTFTEGERAGQTWALDLACCSDPMCACMFVEFRCWPDDSQEGEPLCFTLDARARELDSSSIDRLDIKTAEFARSVVAHFREEDWTRLANYCEEDKCEMLETMDVRDLAGSFPEELVGTELVAYGQVFPFAELFFFEHEGTEWVAEDVYFLNRKSSASEVGLTFSVAEETDEDDPVDPDNDLLLRYDFRAGTVVTLSHGKQGTPPAKALMASLKAEYPKFRQTVAKRHADLRFLNEAAIKRRGLNQPEVRAVAKTGRNDPCPCGSGKKHKKCCGA